MLGCSWERATAWLDSANVVSRVQIPVQSRVLVVVVVKNEEGRCEYVMVVESDADEI